MQLGPEHGISSFIGPAYMVAPPAPPTHLECAMLGLSKPVVPAVKGLPGDFKVLSYDGDDDVLALTPGGKFVVVHAACVFKGGSRRVGQEMRRLVKSTFKQAKRRLGLHQSTYALQAVRSGPGTLVVDWAEHGFSSCGTSVFGPVQQGADVQALLARRVRVLKSKGKLFLVENAVLNPGLRGAKVQRYGRDMAETDQRLTDGKLHRLLAGVAEYNMPRKVTFAQLKEDLACGAYTCRAVAKDKDERERRSKSIRAALGSAGFELVPGVQPDAGGDMHSEAEEMEVDECDAAGAAGAGAAWKGSNAQAVGMPQFREAEAVWAKSKGFSWWPALAFSSQKKAEEYWGDSLKGDFSVDRRTQRLVYYLDSLTCDVVSLSGTGSGRNEDGIRAFKDNVSFASKKQKPSLQKSFVKACEQAAMMHGCAVLVHQALHGSKKQLSPAKAKPASNKPPPPGEKRSPAPAASSTATAVTGGTDSAPAAASPELMRYGFASSPLRRGRWSLG